jgi:hypothetical protein
MHAQDYKKTTVRAKNFHSSSHFYSIFYKNDVDQIAGAGEIGAYWGKLVSRPTLWKTQKTAPNSVSLPGRFSTLSTTITVSRCRRDGAMRGFQSFLPFPTPASPSSSFCRRKNCRKSLPISNRRTISLPRSGANLCGSYFREPAPAPSTSRGVWCSRARPARCSISAARSYWPVAEHASKSGIPSSGARTAAPKRAPSPTSPTVSVFRI